MSGAPTLRLDLGETEGSEFVGVAARAVADLDHFPGEIDRRNRDHAFSRRAQSGVAVIAFADDAGNERGSKSTIMCQDMVMTLARPDSAFASRTTGPGSIDRLVDLAEGKLAQRARLGSPDGLRAHGF